MMVSAWCTEVHTEGNVNRECWETVVDWKGEPYVAKPALLKSNVWAKPVGALRLVDHQFMVPTCH